MEPWNPEKYDRFTRGAITAKSELHILVFGRKVGRDGAC